MTTEFVKGWLLLDTLGEGRFGEVKLLMNKDNHDMVAVKVLTIENDEQDKQIKKEICIHKNIQHENIIKFYGERRDIETNIEYIFLEYAENGELFSIIEPDIGIMDNQLIAKIFQQLLNGVEYLHRRGIVHRDLKPENLLLNKNNQIKICDFGMATLFRYNGKERQLQQICGSIPYIAPEVLQNRPHNAEPIDIWSCGIILVAMLTGELPWLEAMDNNEQYNKWINKKNNFYLHLNPWYKIDTIIISLIKLILESNPKKRLNIDRIRKHCAYKNFIKKINSTNNDENRKSINNNRKYLKNINIISSQPQNYQDCNNNNNNLNDNDDDINYISFSQPNRIQDMFLSTQTQMELMMTNNNCNNQQSISQGGLTPPELKLYLNIVKRMTRFIIIDKNFNDTIRLLEQTFDELKWLWKKQTIIGQYKIEIISSYKHRIPSLIFRTTINDLNQNQSMTMKKKILIDFRLAKGDGIEFKRQFLLIKNLLKPFIQQQSHEQYFNNYDFDL